MQTTSSSSTLTPNQLQDSPELGRQPFGSWPTDGSRPAGYYTLPLPPEAGDFYRENGFLVVENCLKAEEIAELRDETTGICKGERGDFRGLQDHGPDATDDEILRSYLCIHFPHKISASMMRYTAHPAYQEILRTLIGPNVKCMQSMLFIKAAGKPGQAWHQDEFYIPTRDRSLTGGWLAMDDATVENGCLWVIPGSHKHGILWPQQAHDDRRFDCAGEAQFHYTVADSVPVEVKAGSIVFFNGYLLHRSLPNHATTGYRRVLVNHYMSAESLLPWHMPREGDGKLMGTLDYRDIFMVTGEDPYAQWKPIEDRATVHVRPSGEGGCGDPRHNLKPAVNGNKEAPQPASAGGGQMGG